MRKFSIFHFLVATKKGFTLIELLVVIAIIGMLTALGTVNYVTVRSRSRDAQRKSDLRQIQSALELYRSDQGAYPASGAVRCGQPLTAGGVTYMQKVPCDPLNTGQYVYTYVPNGTTYSLVTCLENVNDTQKDATNNASYCAGGTTNWSYTLTNP